ncbi:hypothetical protein H920_17998 [Fukomys damarensis]|uniref:Uncharacterized protein n=1 Tax=Fukomys damarensis TaxID=885580 RepID=A0A091CR00_FUKDA|nr:hypothetical protein H920_17998 [Fukomys damarensis]
MPRKCAPARRRLPCSTWTPPAQDPHSGKASSLGGIKVQKVGEAGRLIRFFATSRSQDGIFLVELKEALRAWPAFFTIQIFTQPLRLLCQQNSSCYAMMGPVRDQNWNMVPHSSSSWETRKSQKITYGKRAHISQGHRMQVGRDVCHSEEEQEDAAIVQEKSSLAFSSSNRAVSKLFLAERREHTHQPETQADENENLLPDGLQQNQGSEKS